MSCKTSPPIKKAHLEQLTVEYRKLEMQEIFIRTREYINIRLQIYSLLGSAHFLTLGFAFAYQKISILGIAIVLLIALIIVDKNLKSVKAAFELRGMQLEDLYATDPETSLLHIVVAVSSSSRKWAEKLRAVNSIRDPQERIRTLRGTLLGYSGTLVFPMILCLIEIGLGISVWLSGWKIF
jgi:hypothetical protein